MSGTKIAGLAIAAMVVLSALYLVWYLSYSVGTSVPETVVIADLPDAVNIHWGKDDDIRIHATTLRSAMVALGYVHGTRKAWPIILWRQVALGKLSQWSNGPSTHSIDYLTYSLQLRKQALASYRQLSERHRFFLEAYTAGLNAALRQNHVQFGQEFVLLNQEPEPWEAWHTLALERLFAWLMVPASEIRVSEKQTEPLASFLDANTQLRKWLHLGNFDNSIAWTIRDDATLNFFQRHVYGNMALSLYQQISFYIANEDPLHATSLPGTLSFPAGQSTHGSWAVLPHSTARLRQVPGDISSTIQQRMTYSDGSESLVFSHMYMEQDLAFPPSGVTVSDSLLWVLQWNGLTPGSDIGAWLALFEGQHHPFTLLSGHGLHVTANQEQVVLGNPPVQRPLPGGVLVGLSVWSSHIADGITRKNTSNIEDWLGDTYSSWAESIAPDMIALAQRHNSAEHYHRALELMRNWDYHYRRQSIAASIFDTWMALYAEAAGLSDIHVLTVDSTINPQVLQSSLEAAIDTLTTRFSPDYSQWRWANAYPDRRYFPVWSVQGVKTNTRFIAMEWSGNGHPSTLTWNFSPLLFSQATSPSSTWEAWMTVPSQNTISIRKNNYDPYKPLGRHSLSESSQITVSYPSVIVTSTILTPSDH